MLRVAFLAVALALNSGGQEQELIQKTERNPNSAEAHYALGVFYFQTARHDLAARSFERAADLAPSNALYWKMLGAAYAAQSRFELAEAPLRKACELDPKLEGACYYYGRNLYTENKFEPAVRAFERALRYGPPGVAVARGARPGHRARGTGAGQGSGKVLSPRDPLRSGRLTKNR
ncbi:MAG: tetratricopeptide repeat protein [Rhodospirillales bacterium]